MTSTRPPGPGPGPKKILLVDDDELILEVAQLALEAVGGYQVSTAGGGEEALAVAARERPDVILLDMMMPGVDGPETVAALRANPQTHGIPVILLTAKTSASVAAPWSDLGVAGLIAKPFDPMRLSRQVADLLGWAS